MAQLIVSLALRQVSRGEGVEGGSGGAAAAGGGGGGVTGTDGRGGEGVGRVDGDGGRGGGGGERMQEGSDGVPPEVLPMPMLMMR